MRLNQRKNKVLVLALAGALTVSGIPVGGRVSAGRSGIIMAQAATRSPVTEYDEETLAKFADDVLEYWEIPGLIEQYNITFRNQLESFYYSPGGSTGLTKTQLLELAAELRSEAADLEYDAEELKDELGKSGYNQYKENVKALKHYAKQLEDEAAGKSASGSAAIRSLRILREEQTRFASAKMREYQKLAAQNEIQKKNLEIAEQAYESAKRQKELGLYSAENVLDAERALNSARAAAASAKSAFESGKQDLLVMLGWRYDANPQIMPVPDPDTGKIAAFRPEVDVEKAIENNYTLYTTRSTDSSAQGGAVAKARTIQDQEKLVRQNFDLLYQGLLQIQASYQAAETAFSIAETAKTEADRRNSVGLLSRRDYLTAEVSYLTAKAARDSAALDLTAAIEDYEWAVKGMMDIGV